MSSVSDFFLGGFLPGLGRGVHAVRDRLHHQPAPGAYEQEPGDWLRAVQRVVASLGEAVPAGRWRAIGLSGMIPTLVTLGPGDEALVPDNPA
jgi:sugar (pentulose or hexulose) kinase